MQWAAAVGALQWFHRGLVLLVIACPCALVISTPVTVVSGLYQAARQGILVKGAEFLEKSAEFQNVALDKTGTVTTGAMQLIDIDSFDQRSPDELLALAAALEQHSEHPVAHAIRGAAARRDIAPATIPTLQALRGFGVRGDLNGDTYFLGNDRLFRGPEFRLSDEDSNRIRNDWDSDSSGSIAKQSQSASGTQVWLGTSTRILGKLQLADQPRPQISQAITELRQLGARRVVMLTGDNAAAAAAIAKQIGVDEVFADLLPQQKIDHIRELSEQGNTAMVGDGVNDAPALAAADVGIALGGQASDTALETADVVIMTPDLSKVAELMRISRRCRTLLKQNIAFSLATKIGVVIIAALGLATMWMAVAADVGASLLVIANGLRIIDRASGPIVNRHLPRSIAELLKPPRARRPMISVRRAAGHSWRSPNRTKRGLLRCRRPPDDRTAE